MIVLFFVLDLILQAFKNKTKIKEKIGLKFFIKSQGVFKIFFKIMSTLLPCKSNCVLTVFCHQILRVVLDLCFLYASSLQILNPHSPTVKMMQSLNFPPSLIVTTL